MRRSAGIVISIDKANNKHGSKWQQASRKKAAAARHQRRQRHASNGSKEWRRGKAQKRRNQHEKSAKAAWRRQALAKANDVNQHGAAAYQRINKQIMKIIIKWPRTS